MKVNLLASQLDLLLCKNNLKIHLKFKNNNYIRGEDRRHCLWTRIVLRSQPGEQWTLLSKHRESSVLGSSSINEHSQSPEEPVTRHNKSMRDMSGTRVYHLSKCREWILWKTLFKPQSLFKTNISCSLRVMMRLWRQSGWRVWSSERCSSCYKIDWWWRGATQYRITFCLVGLVSKIHYFMWETTQEMPPQAKKRALQLVYVVRCS